MPEINDTNQAQAEQAKPAPTPPIAPMPPQDPADRPAGVGVDKAHGGSAAGVPIAPQPGAVTTYPTPTPSELRQLADEGGEPKSPEGRERLRAMRIENEQKAAKRAEEDAALKAARQAEDAEIAAKRAAEDQEVFARERAANDERRARANENKEKTGQG